MNINMEILPKSVREQCRKALLPYLSENCPSMIQNPILLMNYLHQKSLIPRPIYSIIHKNETPQYFEMSCSVNKSTTIGVGRSKKMAKNDAAQKFIDSLLTGYECDEEIEQVMKNLPESQMEINTEHTDTTTSQNFHQYLSTKAFYEDDLSNIYSFENNSKSSNILEPQGDFGDSRLNSCCFSVFKTENSTCGESVSTVASSESDQSKLFNPVKFNDVEGNFDPFPRPKYRNKRKKKQILNRNQKCSIMLSHDKVKQPLAHSSENTLILETSNKNLNNSNADTANVSSEPSKDNHCRETVNSLADYFDPFQNFKCYKSSIRRKGIYNPEEQTVDVSSDTLEGRISSVDVRFSKIAISKEENTNCENYFDPFQNLRSDIPNVEEKFINKFDGRELNDIISGVVKNKTVVNDFNSLEIIDSKESNTKYVDYLNPFSSSIVEQNAVLGDKDGGTTKIKPVNGVVNSLQINVPKEQDTKSPFQVLYEKVLKKFRLVPRCNIEGSQNSFKCKLVVDTLVGFGEGASKKQAKMNAAIDLLRQIE